MFNSIFVKNLLCVVIFAFTGLVCRAQKVIEPDLSALLKANKISAVNRSVTQISTDVKKNVLHLDGKPDAGIAWIDDIRFSDGIIEFDVKGKNVLQQSFVGIAFHGSNDSTYDAIYFRPFNFKSTETERRNHSVQYISLPKFDWPVLRKEHPNQYEKPIDPAPEPEEWLHAKIVVDGLNVKVFVNNNAQASLVVKKLGNSNNGKIGFWVGYDSDGDFSELKIAQK
ncbi:hypothetical protein [Dyadobacter frigoris]|uniref:DUF1080 domain-containing protein n=1 Tax=Dyadobacter frigoris TaxID=2576211 RepID=A0A4U6D628_9BACT|nr:hypothetical protein [Dyadobacter frigoris]TKT91691.1 hypothetical protein FDK13_15115 [Dyadobacter frigoris]GLU51743.1 hypothetical protein Dfri01_12040 [Dyadobacter frigoris]